MQKQVDFVQVFLFRYFMERANMAAVPRPSQLRLQESLREEEAGGLVFSVMDAPLVLTEVWNWLP
jgi:hypothetical protein